MWVLGEWAITYLGVTMYKNLLIVFFAFATLFNFGCGDKGDEPCGITIYDPIPDSLSHFRFLPGTYWVYQETTTNDLDSIWVTSASLDTTTWISGFGSGCDKAFSDTEIHSINLEGSRYGNMLTWYLYAGGICWTDSSELKGGGSGYLFDQGLRIYHVPGLRWGGWYQGGVEYGPTNYQMNLDTSIQVAGMQYSNVVFLRTEQVSFFDFLPQPTAWDTYWTEDGIIRWDVRDEQDNIIETWDLVRWNIVR